MSHWMGRGQGGIIIMGRYVRGVAYKERKRKIEVELMNKGR